MRIGGDVSIGAGHISASVIIGAGGRPDIGVADRQRARQHIIDSVIDAFGHDRVDHVNRSAVPPDADAVIMKRAIDQAYVRIAGVRIDAPVGAVNHAVGQRDKAGSRRNDALVIRAMQDAARKTHLRMVVEADGGSVHMPRAGGRAAGIPDFHMFERPGSPIEIQAHPVARRRSGGVAVAIGIPTHRIILDGRDVNRLSRRAFGGQNGR